MRLSRALGRKLRRILAARQVTEAEAELHAGERASPLRGREPSGPSGSRRAARKKLRHELYRLQRFGRAGAASVLLEQPTCQPWAWRAKTRVESASRRRLARAPEAEDRAPTWAGLLA